MSPFKGVDSGVRERTCGRERGSLGNKKVAVFVPSLGPFGLGRLISRLGLSGGDNM